MGQGDSNQTLRLSLDWFLYFSCSVPTTYNIKCNIMLNPNYLQKMHLRYQFQIFNYTENGLCNLKLNRIKLKNPPFFSKKGKHFFLNHDQDSTDSTLRNKKKLFGISNFLLLKHNVLSVHKCKEITYTYALK